MDLCCLGTAAAGATVSGLLEEARWLCKHVLKGQLWFVEEGRYDPGRGRSIPIYRIFRRSTGCVATRSSVEGLVKYLKTQCPRT